MSDLRAMLVRAAKIAVFLTVLALVLYVVLDRLEVGGVPMPHPPQLAKIERLGQGWSPKVAREFHRTSQGTKILPLSWFLALERPSLDRVLPPGKLADRDYLGRFGFLYDDVKEPDKKTEQNNYDLPIGFAVEKGFVAPYASPPIAKATPVVGLTCAACHTGRLDLEDPKTHQVTGVLIEGGSAMTDLSGFQKAVGLSLAYTVKFPERFRRFAADVICKNVDSTDDEEVALMKDLEATFQAGLEALDYANTHDLYPLEVGFSRTDALGLIGNRVFSSLDIGNQSVIDAPVNFPHLWDTPWFDWVQYNASIRMPLARNVGEALGVGAVINLTGPEADLYNSSVNLDGLARMEDWLGGDNPFEGLQPPRWEKEVFATLGKPGEIDRAKAELGRVLYEKHCQDCHLPSRKDLKADFDSKDPKYFPEDFPGSGRRFLKVPVVDLYQIGTDANQALNFYRRVAVTPLPAPKDRKSTRGGAARSETISAEVGLYRVTSFIRRKKFQEKGLLAPDPMDKVAAKAFNANPARTKERAKFDRFRHVDEEIEAGDPATILKGTHMGEVITANLGYKARPLDGIWATPPYLHNSSVPSLYHLLLPADRRPEVFYLGSRKFDPKHVGYVTDQVENAFAMDTRLSGNRNSGHEYRNLSLEELESARKQPWDGVSSREQRWAWVLGIDEAALGKLADEERGEKVREASKKILKNPDFKGFRGVLGVEFTDVERWQLVEYLKTL